VLEPHIHIPSQTATTWAGRRTRSEDNREDASFQIRRWKSCAMCSQGAGRGEHDWIKWGKRAVYKTGQGWALLSKGSARTNREKQRSMFDLASLPAVPHLPQSMLTSRICLALAGYKSATGMAALSHNLPMTFLFTVPRRRQTKLWLLALLFSLTARQKEAAEGPSCLQNLQQEEL